MLVEIALASLEKEIVAEAKRGGTLVVVCDPDGSGWMRDGLQSRLTSRGFRIIPGETPSGYGYKFSVLW